MWAVADQKPPKSTCKTAPWLNPCGNRVQQVRGVDVCWWRSWLTLSLTAAGRGRELRPPLNPCFHQRRRSSVIRLGFLPSTRKLIVLSQSSWQEPPVLLDCENLCFPTRAGAQFKTIKAERGQRCVLTAIRGARAHTHARGRIFNKCVSGERIKASLCSVCL